MADKKNINKLISNPLVQTFLVYVSGGWIVLEMTDYFINHYGLTERFRDILLIIMIIGLPVAILLTWYFSRDRETREEKDNRLIRILLKKPWFSVPAVLVLGLALFTAVRFIYQNNDRPTESLSRYENIRNTLYSSGNEVSLAVLPFKNFTGNSDEDWLVASQHETLIHELSKISQVRPLRIISGYTVNAFKNYNKPVTEIAREENIDYLIEASVLSITDTVELQLRMIQVDPEESVVWAESSSTDYTNIFRYYSSLAGQIAGKVNLELTPEEKERVSNTREINPESYKAYLRGMHHINLLTLEGFEKGLEYLHEAVDHDPAEPYAHAGLALGYLEIAHSPMDPGDALTKAESAARTAFSLDSTLAIVYLALAEVYLYETWKFDLAEEYFLKALAIDPNLAIAHYHYAWTLFLFGHLDEAIIEHNLAKRYDPFNPLHSAYLGILYINNGQIEEALKVTRESLELRENYRGGYFVMGQAYLHAGEIDKAIETHKRLKEMSSAWAWALGHTYAATGQVEKAEEILEEIESGRINGFRAYGLAAINATLGRKDEALKWLAYEPHHAFTAWAAVNYEFENLWDDPRFDEFLGRLNLPDK